MNVLISGITGFIGSSLASGLIQRGHSIVGLTRNPNSKKCNIEGVKYVRWGSVNDNWIKELTDDTVIVNLAGENLFGLRWTKKKKSRILQSRLWSAEQIFDAIADKEIPVIQISAVGYYPVNTEFPLSEDSDPGSSFLSNVCVQWEQRAQENTSSRTVIFRLGVVLGRGGGSLGLMSLPIKLFIGGKLGSGKQIIPWIHIDDVIGAITYAIENPVQGIFNLVAPNPVSNSEFTKTLARILHRPSFLPTPGFLLKILLGEMGAIVLDGNNVSSSKLVNEGYSFKFRTLEDALRSIYQ